MADMALFRWWMNTTSWMMSGIKASIAPAPRPWMARAAKCWFREVLSPAQSPPAQAQAPAKSSTGRRPTAMDSGTSRKLAMPFASSGTVASIATMPRGGGGTPFGITAKGLTLIPWLWAWKFTSLIVRGSRPAYSRRKMGSRAPMMISAERERAPTVP